MSRRAAAAAAPAGAGAGPASDASSGGLSLPPELLAAVLQHLPASARLGSAALVSRAWAAAAVAATTAVCAQCLYTEERCSALDRWLAAHGSQLVSLRVDSVCGDKPLALPAPGQLVALQQLELKECEIRHSLRTLSALTRLSALQLVNTTSTRVSSNNVASVSALLKALPQLRSLDLGGDNKHFDGGAAAVAPVIASRLTQLQSLSLRGSFCGSDAGLLAGLPLGLTRLALESCKCWWSSHATAHMTISSTTCPTLGELTALRDLELAHVELEEPGVFFGLSRLTRFKLRGFYSLPDDGYTPAQAATTTSGTPALLRLLGQQTALQHLEIKDALQHPLGPYGMWAEEEEEYGERMGSYAAEPDEPPLYNNSSDDDDDVPEPRPYLLPLYAGLVHSTLTHLSLDNCLLPKRAGSVMFGRRGLRLPHLCSLELESPKGPEGGGYPDTFIPAAGLRSIVKCCVGGALCSLHLLGAVEHGADYGVLKRLTCLTHLSIGGANTTGVAQLTRLRSLSITHASFDDVDLVDVAKHLTQLTYLGLSGVDVQTDLDWMADEDGACAIFEHDPGSDDERCSMPVCEHVRQVLEAAGVWARLCARLEARQLRRALRSGA